MIGKVDNGCMYNADPFARKHKIVLCDHKPEYKDYCLEHLPYKLKLEREHDLIPKETRQKYLDLINAGKSIGEARDAVGISFEGALEITNRAIGNFMYLKKEAV
jgi:hypothetical protein